MAEGEEKEKVDEKKEKVEKEEEGEVKEKKVEETGSRGDWGWNMAE